MSQENVEIVRRMWDAFLAADFQTALSFYAPDVEWDGTNLPDGQIGRGHEAILAHITDGRRSGMTGRLKSSGSLKREVTRSSSSCERGGGATAA
jgi:hypothetical protein